MERTIPSGKWTDCGEPILGSSSPLPEVEAVELVAVGHLCLNSRANGTPEYLDADPSHGFCRDARDIDDIPVRANRLDIQSHHAGREASTRPLRQVCVAPSKRERPSYFLGDAIPSVGRTNCCRMLRPIEAGRAWILTRFVLQWLVPEGISR
jgi:hypothetical protein